MITEEDRLRAAALVARFPSEGVPEKQAWRALQAAMEAAIENREQGLLFALADACAGHYLLLSWPRQNAWRAAGQIEEASALRRFLEAAREPPPSELPWGHAPLLPDGPARNLGAMLAYAQDDALLERELEHFGLEPSLQGIFACWIQERVARGSPIGGSAFVREFWRALPRSHPLARLPLQLRPLETGLFLESQRCFDLTGNWFQFGGSGPPVAFGPEGSWRGKFDELPAEPDELAAVASEPGLCPNSTWEGRVFRLAQRPPSLKALCLSAFPLECLGAKAAARVTPATSGKALELLAMLGTSGGADTEARSAAYGRLLAWRSLAALVGLPSHAHLEEIEALALRTEWLCFQSDSRWFHRVSLDVGLVALRPDDTLAVVAITDSD